MSTRWDGDEEGELVTQSCSDPMTIDGTIRPYFTINSGKNGGGREMTQPLALLSWW